MNWLKKFWKKLTAPPPNPAHVLLPRSAISPGKPVKQADDQFGLLTPRAKQALAFAHKEAERFLHTHIATEHVLLGLLRLERGVAVNVLQKLGLDLETARAQVEKQDGIGADAGSCPLEYTPGVKKVIDEAAKEAKNLKHTYIGTEHILLGILSEQGGVPAVIFKELGIEAEKVRQEIMTELTSAEQKPMGAIAAPSGEASLSNFTPRAQQVLALARKEADQFNHNFVGTEHLLLGLVVLGQGVAVNVLSKLGINLEKVRSEVEKQVGKGPDQKMIGNIPYTPRVKKVLAMAAKEAKALNHTYVGTEHILLGLLREGDGPAARILKNLGMDLKKTREEILKELNPAINTQPRNAPEQPASSVEPVSSGGVVMGSEETVDFGVMNFTARAQQALAFARREAERFHHNFVGTDHLFLGMMKLEDCTAIKVLRNMGVVLDTVRMEIEKQIGTAPDQKITSNIPITPRIKKVLALAYQEAKALRHNDVGTEHILLGILRDGDGIPARVLAGLDIRLDDTRKEILKELDRNKRPTASETMTSPNLPRPVDTTARYDVFCREQPDKLVVYRNVLFKSVRSFFPRPDAPTEWEYAELEEADGQCVFVAKSTIVRFSPQGAAFEAEDI